MKIAFLSKMFPPVTGGSAVYAYEVANTLGKRGHDVDVYTQLKTDDETQLNIHENVSVHTLARARRYLVAFETLYYSIRARYDIHLDNYDLIHGTLMPASTIALSDRSTFDTPIVLTSHSFALALVSSFSPAKPAEYLLKYVFHPLNVVMDNVAARSADKIIAISGEMQNHLVNGYNIDGNSITQISHGVDIDRFRPLDNKHDAVSEEKLTLLFVGRLISLKGADLAVKSLAAADCDEVELLIAGTGRLESDLKRYAQRVGIADQVKFLGHVNQELVDLYSSADATLFASQYEGFGLIILESMASGTPVIGTPAGGFPDIVTDGHDGFIVDRDPDAIGDLITSLTHESGRLSEMGQSARELAENRTWNVVAKEIEAVYEEVLAGDSRNTFA